MTGFDAVVLRGICANFFEAQVEPALRDLRQTHANLDSRVQELAAALEAQQGAVSSSTALAAKLRELSAEVDQRACIDKVPTMCQFANLQTSVESSIITAEFLKLEADVERKFGQLASKFELNLKAGDGANDAPTMCQFTELVAQVERKANAADVPSVARLVELAAEELANASARDVATLSQMKKLAATVDRKANTSNVPTMSQFQKLVDTVEGKVDASLCPTLAQVEELAAVVQRSNPAASQLQKLTAELARKPNVEDVATSSRCEQLACQLQLKANTDDVPSKERFDQLASTMEKKISFLAEKGNSGGAVCQPMVWFVPGTADDLPAGCQWAQQAVEFHAGGQWGGQWGQQVQWQPTSQSVGQSDVESTRSDGTYQAELILSHLQTENGQSTVQQTDTHAAPGIWQSTAN